MPPFAGLLEGAFCRNGGLSNQVRMLRSARLALLGRPVGGGRLVLALVRRWIHDGVRIYLLLVDSLYARNEFVFMPGT